MNNIKTARILLSDALNICNISPSSFTLTEIKDYIHELISVLDHSTFSFTFGYDEVLFIHENSLDQIWEHELNHLLDEILEDVPSFVIIDRERTIDNLRTDGVGHTFNSYDGVEYVVLDYSLFRR